LLQTLSVHYYTDTDIWCL